MGFGRFRLPGLAAGVAGAAVLTTAVAGGVCAGGGAMTVATAGTLSGARHLAPAVLGPRDSALWTSSNWSGYALGTKTTPNGTYTSVSAKWRVPVLKTNTGTKYSSQWIGIDGFTNTHLIQTGTEVDYLGGQAVYAVWWEILPAPETPINKPIKPGQTITASISKGSAGQWTIKISNGTWTFTKSTGYTGPGQSVEWIVEAPQVGGSISSIAHTARVTFAHVKVNGANPKLVATDGGELRQNGKIREVPSLPSAIGDAFTMGYGTKIPPAPKG
jgi:hypothetical protein